jgi:hypothetical protein
MHVPSYPRVVALLAMLAGFAGDAQAVEFDEKLKAPLMKDPVALRSQAESYVAKFSALQAAGPRELISNRALSAQRFDLTWQIQQAIDTHRPLGDLTALGLEARDDGGYHVDYNASPQWEQLEEVFLAWLPEANWEMFGMQLTQRGFRVEDVAAVRDYVSAHDARKMSLQRSLPLAVSFSKIVKKYDRIKRPVDDGLVLSYLYQRTRVNAETTREWAEGLLNTLDAQRARILIAYFSEMSSTGIWAPSDQRTGIDHLLGLMRLPNYEQLAAAEAAGGQP